MLIIPLFRSLLQVCTWVNLIKGKRKLPFQIFSFKIVFITLWYHRKYTHVRIFLKVQPMGKVHFPFLGEFRVCIWRSAA